MQALLLFHISDHDGAYDQRSADHLPAAASHRVRLLDRGASTVPNRRGHAIAAGLRRAVGPTDIDWRLPSRLPEGVGSYHRRFDFSPTHEVEQSAGMGEVAHRILVLRGRLPSAGRSTTRGSIARHDYPFREIRSLFCALDITIVPPS